MHGSTYFSSLTQGRLNKLNQDLRDQRKRRQQAALQAPQSQLPGFNPNGAANGQPQTGGQFGQPVPQGGGIQRPANMQEFADRYRANNPTPPGMEMIFKDQRQATTFNPNTLPGFNQNGAANGQPQTGGYKPGTGYLPGTVVSNPNALPGFNQNFDPNSIRSNTIPVTGGGLPGLEAEGINDAIRLQDQIRTAGLGQVGAFQNNPLFGGLQAQAQNLINAPIEDRSQQIFANLARGIRSTSGDARDALDRNLAGRFGFNSSGADPALRQELSTQAFDTLGAAAHGVALSEGERQEQLRLANLRAAQDVFGQAQGFRNNLGQTILDTPIQAPQFPGLGTFNGGGGGSGGYGLGGRRTLGWRRRPARKRVPQETWGMTKETRLQSRARQEKENAARVKEINDRVQLRKEKEKAARLKAINNRLQRRKKARPNSPGLIPIKPPKPQLDDGLIPIKPPKPQLDQNPNWMTV